MPIIPGDRLGPYEIVEPLGAGGMGEVYRAHDSRLRRDVAVKVLRESLDGAAGWERFEREARAASALSHPNICAVYDVGEAEGRPYLVMELLEGQTLREYAGGQPAAPATVIDLGAQIADALDAAHSKGIVHRDIKAGNIMVTGRRHVKVLDFGLAKYTPEAAEADATRTMEPPTAAGTVVGTPHYMAPELLQGKPADARSDLWAVGVVLHEMLTGKLPFQGSTAFEVSAAILSQSPPPLPAGLPPGLRTIVERCLAKRPEDRYRNAAELRASLEAQQSQQPASTGKHRWWMVGAAAVLVLAGVWFWQRQAAQPAIPTAGPTLTTGAARSVVREANDAFELAMAQLNQQSNARARDLFQRAITLDPHFAAAHQFLGITYDIQVLTGESNDANLFYKADEELRRALREDPSLVDVHSELAGVAFMQGDRQRALAELKLLPRDPRSYGWRLNLHYMAEENSEAKELALSILGRDPLFQPARYVLTEILLTEGDFAGALRHAQTLTEQAPGGISGVFSLSSAYLATGELTKARSVLEEKRALLSNNYWWRLAWALLLAAGNNREEALRAMDAETLKWADANFFVTLRAAEFYALLGDQSKAIEWLDRAVRKGDERVQWFRKNPRLAGIRADPGFQRILDALQSRRKLRQGQ